MFRFLSLFRRNKDEQLNDNDYDFNEVPTPDGVQGMTENQVQVDNAFGGKQEHHAKPVPTVDKALQEQADQTRITDIGVELRSISGEPQAVSGEDQTDQEGKSPFDIANKTLLGKGGENFVYDIPDDASVVGRVAIEPLIDQLAQDEEQPGTEEATARDTLQATVAAENATYDKLCTYFGNEHIPQTTRSVRQVPTSREFLEAIHKAKGRDIPDVAQLPTDMLTIVAIQEKVPEINDDKSLDVQGGLAEARDPKVMNTENYRQSYDAATQALVCDPENAAFDLDQFLVIHPALRGTVEQADTNPQLKDALKDFVQKAMQYSKETGKSLDLNGAKNILFFEDSDDNEDSTWRYKLVDATSPYAEAALRKTKELMEKVIAKEPIEDHIDRHLLRSAVNYQRTLNGLAKQLGVEDHLDLIPYASSITPSEFWDVLYDGGPPESSGPEQVAA